MTFIYVFILYYPFINHVIEKEKSMEWPLKYIE